MRQQGEHNGAGSQSQRPQRVLPRSQTKFSIDPGYERHRLDAKFEEDV
jgi:hypothetical protein